MAEETRRTFCPEDGHPCYAPEGPEPEDFQCANLSLCKSFEQSPRPSPSTVTDEGLATEQIAKAIYAQRPFCVASSATTLGHQVAQTFDWDGAPAYYQEDIRQLARAALEASGHTALLREIEGLRELLRDCRFPVDYWMSNTNSGEDSRLDKRIEVALSRPLAGGEE